MGNNERFVDIMDNTNNIAKGYGFKNGADWVDFAVQSGELDQSRCSNYKNCHNLRIRMAHGSARDIFVSDQTLNYAYAYNKDIKRSSLRRNKNKPILPDGTFRANQPYGSFRVNRSDGTPRENRSDGTSRGNRSDGMSRENRPFVKSFNWTGSDGCNYYFKFVVTFETNYLDDGHGGRYDTGYFIHILEAPYFDYARERLHEFHLIRVEGDDGYDFHICWNKVIETFKEANAVMYVWLQRYVELVVVLKRNSKISDKRLVNEANKKHILPKGTFRAGKKSHARNAYSKKTIYIERSVYDEIMSLLGTRKPELGGMLGWSEDQNIIDSFVFDQTARVNSVEYTPNTKFLNDVLDKWDGDGKYFAGFVHSHPGDFNILSDADIDYAMQIIQAFDLSFIFMPIVTSSYSYKSEMNPYVIYRSGKIERCKLEIYENKKASDKTIGTEPLNEGFDENLLKQISAGFDEMDKRYIERSDKNAEDVPIVKGKKLEKHKGEDANIQGTFARIENVIDVNYLKECTIIGIGCGGARGFYEEMARLGVGNFILIDGDKNDYTNIASQGAYIDEVDKYKTETVKERLHRINSEISCKVYDIMLTDELDDKWIENSLLDKLDITKTLLCGFTDDFYAQARVNNIAIKYNLPIITAQHHEQGLTSEIVYYYNGVSKYMPQEILTERYESYKNGYVNDVTSVGSPIFNTSRLNALCSKIALGILLYKNYPASLFCSFLTLKPNNNIIIVRQHYLERTNSSFKECFENELYDMFDDVLWLEPDNYFEIKKMDKNIEDTRIIF